MAPRTYLDEAKTHIDYICEHMHSLERMQERLPHDIATYIKINVAPNAYILRGLINQRVKSDAKQT